MLPAQREHICILRWEEIPKFGDLDTHDMCNLESTAKSAFTNSQLETLIIQYKESQ